MWYLVGLFIASLGAGLFASRGYGHDTPADIELLGVFFMWLGAIIITLA